MEQPYPAAGLCLGQAVILFNATIRQRRSRPSAPFSSRRRRAAPGVHDRRDALAARLFRRQQVAQPVGRSGNAFKVRIAQSAMIGDRKGAKRVAGFYQKLDRLCRCL